MYNYITPSMCLMQHFHPSQLLFYSRRYKGKWEYCWWNSCWCGDISPGHFWSQSRNYCLYFATEEVHLYALGMFISACLFLLCRKESTIKDLFPTGHFKVAHKQGASPHAQDISLDQLSSEPRLCVRQLRDFSYSFLCFYQLERVGQDQNYPLRLRKWRLNEISRLLTVSHNNLLHLNHHPSSPI